MIKYATRDTFACFMLEPGDLKVFRVLCGLHGQDEQERMAIMEQPQLADDLANPDYRYFGLFDGDEPVGVGWVFKFRSERHGEIAFLDTVHIRPDYRGRALTDLIYASAQQALAATTDFNTLVADAEASNGRICRGLLRAGFNQVGSYTVGAQRLIRFGYPLDADRGPAPPAPEP